MAGISTEAHAFTGWDGDIDLSVDDGANFTPLGGHKKYGPSGRSMSTSDGTSLKSPGRYKVKLPGQKDSGTVTIDIVADYNDPGQLLLASAFDADQALTVRVKYPALKGMQTGPVDTYRALITKLGMPDMSMEASTYSVEFDITGVITTQAGA